MAGSEIDQILNLLNLSVPIVLPKAMEIERIMRFKVPQGALKKGEVCRSVIAIDFACRILHISILKDSLISQAAVGKKLYNDSYNTCKRLLKIEIPTTITIDTLSVKYGNERITKFAKSLLHTYLKVNTQCKSRNDLLHAVAFYVTAKYHQINLKLQKFLDDNDLVSIEFDTVMKDIEGHIANHLAHFNYEGEFELVVSSSSSASLTSTTTSLATSSSLTSSTTTSGQPIHFERSLQKISSRSTIENGSSLLSNPSTSTDLSIANLEHNLSSKYRSNNSKRVAESVSHKLISNHSVAEEDEGSIRKRQFTESIFKMWLVEVKEQILLQQKK